MKYLTDCKNIETAIHRAKLKLIDKAKKKGLYENFGATESKIIKDHFIDIGDYSEKMNRNRQALQVFENWCSSYTLSGVSYWK